MLGPRCGDLDSGIEDGRVWITSECGASMSGEQEARIPPLAPSRLTPGRADQKH